MKKKLGLLVLVLFAIVSTAAFAFASTNKEIRVYVDGQLASFPDQRPYIDSNNRTLIPLRFLSESLNMKVGWNSVNKQVTVKDEEIGRVVKIQIGRREYDVNGKKHEMDSEAVLTGKGRTVVPVRSVGEALGVFVDYKNVDGIGIVFNFTRDFPVEKRNETIDKIVKDVKNETKTPIAPPATSDLPRPSELGTTTGKEMGLGSLGGMAPNGHIAKALDECKVLVITKDQLKAQPHQVDGTIIYDFWEDKKASDIGDDGKIIVKAKLLTKLGDAEMFYITNEFHNRGTVTDINKIGKVTEVRCNLTKPREKITVPDIKYFGFWGNVSKEILLVKNPEYKGGW